MVFALFVENDFLADDLNNGRVCALCYDSCDFSGIVKQFFRTEILISSLVLYASAIAAGILDKLEELGIQEGDTVRMYGLSFDYYK